MSRISGLNRSEDFVGDFIMVALRRPYYRRDDADSLFGHAYFVSPQAFKGGFGFSTLTVVKADVVSLAFLVLIQILNGFDRCSFDFRCAHFGKLEHALLFKRINVKS